MNIAYALKALPEPVILSHDASGIGDIDVADPTRRLEVLIGPLDMHQRDRLELYWGDNDSPVDSYTHSPDAPDTNGIFSLYVDTRFIKSGITEVIYTYTAFPSGVVNTSEKTSVTIKLLVPGGIDPNPATPYENEALALPSIVPSGIITSPEGVSATLLPYLNMEVGDKITLSWHGEFVVHRIESQSQVGSPVVIPIPREIVELAGDSDRLEVRYEVRDVVNNWSRWSLPTYTEVEAGNSSLPAPLVPQAPNMVLDLDLLMGKPVQTLVLAYPEMAGSDVITLVVERNTAEGNALEPYVVDKTVANPGSFVEFLLPFEQFLPVTQGRVRLKYSVKKASGVVLRSKSLSLIIAGEVQELEAPSVPAAQNAVLDPASRNVMAVVPPYYFMADGNDVTLVWSGRTANGANVLHEERRTVTHDDVGRVLEFRIPEEKISVLAGGAVQVYYTVVTYTRAFFKSPILQLRVSQDGSIPLPAPTVDDVSTDGVLDPANISLEAMVRIQPFAGMAERDKVTLHWEGRNPEGVFSTYTVLNSGTVGREVVFRVQKSIVVASLNTQVNVWYEVQRGAQTFTSRKLAFIVQEAAVVPLPDPSVKEAKGDALYIADTVNGMTLVVPASARLKLNDRVQLYVNGPNGGDNKEKTILQGDVDRELSLLFSGVLVSANVGKILEFFYSVQRASGVVQRSESVLLRAVGNLNQLPAPTLDTVGPDGVLNPANIPEAGATVRVGYDSMSTGDSVAVSWQGVTAYETPSQVVGGNTGLQFNIPKAFITASAGNAAGVRYSVTRAGTAASSAVLLLRVSQGLVFDTSPVTLGGKIYLLPGSPDVLPAFPAGTTLQRSASGGQAPYVYSSSNTAVAQVDSNGLTSVRGKGTATISVRDALGESKSYPVTVTGVIHCIGLGSGKLSQLSAAAQGQGAHIPSINELNEIFNSFGNRWPMGNGNYWSSTAAAQNIAGMKWYFVKNLVTGANFKLFEHTASLGVALR